MRPSIMSDGATTSAPASACDSASSTSNATVGSFSTMPSVTMPQCPCDVYSQRHTSVTITVCGCAARIARTACCTGPCGSLALLPRSSLCAGSPNSSTDVTPSPAAAPTSATISSTDICATPGIEPIGLRTPSPGQTNSG